jgi:hypothetical protein
MAESLYTGITIQGLYSDQTGDQLFGVLGSAAPASALYIAGTDGTNLRGISVDATGKVNVNATITPPSDNIQAGTITTTQNVAVSTAGTSALMVQITGTWTGTVVFEVSLDGTTWQSTLLFPVFPDGTPAVSSTTANGNWTLPVGGVQQFRVRGNTVATGTANIELTAGQGQYGVVAYQPVAANLNATIVGSKTNNNAAPNSSNLGVLPAVATTAAPTYTTGNAVMLSTDLSGNLRTTATISGTVAVTQSTSPWIVAGGGTAGTPATGVVTIQGIAGGTAVTVSGTVTANAGTGTFTVAGNLTNNNAAPAATNVGVLPAIAETAYSTVTYTTGNQVLPVTDLHGALNSDIQAWHGTELGAATNFGTTPGAVIVGQVNASIFQGTAAISATNTLFSQVSDGTNPMGVMANFGTSPTAVKALNVNASIFSGTTALTNTGGALNVNVSNASVSVAGTLTNNNAAPGANNLGVLPAIANSGTFPAVTLPAYTAGNQVLVRTSQAGSLVTIPADEEYASSINYYSVDTGATLKTVTSATVFPLVSIQSNSAAIQFLIREVQGFTDGSQELFQLIKNPQTLTGANFVTTGIPTGSHIKIDTSATAVTIGTGTVVWSGFASSTPVMKDALLLALAAGTPGDTYTMACQKFGTGTSKAGAQIYWSETAAAV